MSGRFSTNVDMLNTLTSELPEGFSLCREICNAEYLSISQVFYVRWSMFPMIPACQHVLPSGSFQRACILHGILGLLKTVNHILWLLKQLFYCSQVQFDNRFELFQTLLFTMHD